jgi:amino acid adenylation domain-containing protein
VIAMDKQMLSLSLSQREVWLDQQAWPDSTHLNIGGALELKGAFSPQRFQEALNLLVVESDALRLAPLENGSQLLLSRYQYAINLVDLSQAHDPGAAMRDWEQAWIKEPFRLDGTPPWRFAVLQGGREHYYIVIQFHHLIMDGWGTSWISQRMSELYNALEANRAPDPVQAPSYLNFIQESLEYRNSSAFERDGQYWLEQIKELPEPLFERRYQSGKPLVLPDAHIQRHPVLRAAYDRLEHLAAGTSTTTYHWFLAALAIYLASVSNRTELIIGVPSLNRGGKRYKATLGMFVGVMPLHLEVKMTMPVRELIASVSGQLRNAYRHPRYPISELGRVLQVIRKGRGGIFDVLLSFERQDYSCIYGTTAGTASHQTFSGMARYPLGVTICEFQPDQDVELILEGSSDYFSAAEMELFGRRLDHLLTQMVAQPDISLQDLSLVPPEERWGLTEGFHKDVARYDHVVPFIRLFEHQVSLNPGAVALVWDGGRMDYAMLDKQANRLANSLIEHGVGRGSIVSLALARGPEVVVGILAIAKAGAAFLPLDVEAPVARLAHILEESQTRILLVNELDQELFSELPVPSLICRLVEGDVGLAGPAAPEINIEPTDLAYVLYTSGSTGRPKGVMVEHAALSRRLGWIARSWGVTDQDRSAQATQINFDPSLIELLVPLTHGASVALPPAGRLLPESLAAFAVVHGVTMMAFVPSTLQRFLDGLAGRPGLKLRVACSGGEVLSPELAERFEHETKATLFNVYGPTEACIFATSWRCLSNKGLLALPVGQPLDDTRIYVLDHDLRPTPFGVIGDIHIGGSTLARGYLNRPDLDVLSFITDPFLTGGRMYRTGDRGWLGVDGQLHFVGREDRQIKLRGYRIELGEIEVALQSIDGIKQAAVKLVENEGKQAIHAWVGSSQAMNQDFIRKRLAGRLPDYMLPARYSIQSELPITSTGKIDYAALPEMAFLQIDRQAREPNGKLERELLQVWRDTLSRPGLTVQDDFFEHGGDSLAGVGILAGIEKQLGLKVTLHQLVECPTVAAMAEALSEKLGMPSMLISLGTTTRKATLYLAASGHGDLLRFRALAKAMEGACDLHMLQPPSDNPDIGFVELATLYAERIEARGEQEVYIAGFSVGGLAALETARTLRQHGVNVLELFLVDTVMTKLPPGGFAIWRLMAWMARTFHFFDFHVNGRKLATTLNDPGLYAQVRAMMTYRPSAYDGNTLLIKSSGLTFWDHWLFSPWRRVFGTKLLEQEMPGLHGTMFEPGHINALAEILGNRIRHEGA